jgi:hypothetical protein
VFDGGGRVISGLKGNSLFPVQVGNGNKTTEIRNVIVEGEVTSANWVGGIAARVYHDGGAGGTVLRNCENRAKIIGGSGSGTGGVAGCVTRGTLINCRNTGEVTNNGSYSNTGGVAGLSNLAQN